jgi:hypothetical protein
MILRQKFNDEEEAARLENTDNPPPYDIPQLIVEQSPSFALNKDIAHKNYVLVSATPLEMALLRRSGFDIPLAEDFAERG